MIEHVSSEFVEKYIHSASVVHEDEAIFIEEESTLALFDRYVKDEDDRPYYKLDLSDDGVFESISFALSLSLKVPLFAFAVLPHSCDASGKTEVEDTMWYANRIGSLKMYTRSSAVKNPILIIKPLNDETIGNKLFDPDLMIGITAKAMKRRAKSHRRAYAR